MKCPSCNETLLMSEKKGIEIDYCPSCRGIWLDRGELEKIIERSTEPYEQKDTFDRRHNQSYDNNSHKNTHYKKKGSFLSDLFDL